MGQDGTNEDCSPSEMQLLHAGRKRSRDSLELSSKFYVSHTGKSLFSSRIAVRVIIRISRNNGRIKRTGRYK
jgi:hypothetical protein